MRDTICLPSGGSLLAMRRVVLTDNRLELAGDSEPALGHVQLDGFGPADPCPVHLRAGRFGLVEAADSIAAGQPVFAAPDGMVAPAGTVREGIAKTSAGSRGEVIELEWDAETDAEPIDAKPAKAKLPRTDVTDPGVVEDH